MGDLRESIRRCLLILRLIAEHRQDENSNTEQHGDICLGDKDLVHNFIALIFMGRKDYLFDDYFENSWAIFVPSIEYALDLIKDRKIIKEGDQNKVILLSGMYEKLQKESQMEEGMPVNKIRRLIYALYPQKEDGNKVDMVKMTVRVSSCLLTVSQKEMNKVDMKECFKALSSNKWKLDENILPAMPLDNNIVKIEDGKFQFTGL